MNRLSFALCLALSCVIFFGGGAFAQEMPPGEFDAVQFVTGLEGTSGGTVGPDGALYVAESATGRISRIDPQTGEVTTFASGLPATLVDVGIGGVVDVAFIDETAYALVTLVADDVGGEDIVGIYRVDGLDSFTVVADLGEFAAQNVPTNTNIDVPTGVQYAMEPYASGFLVPDGHHNRVLFADLDGTVTEVVAFGNVVPTGLAVSGETVYMAEAGPLPHLPQDGKVISFEPQSPAVSDSVSDVAAGARLLVDVAFGPGGRLYALAQGEWAGPGEAGTPPLPNTGMLVAVNEDGSFTTVSSGLNQPISVDFIGETAYVVTLTGDVLTINMQETCALDTISGTYLFQAQGIVVDEDGELHAYAEAGTWALDGAGHADGIFSAGLGGETIANREFFAATYEVVSGCAFAAYAPIGGEIFELHLFTSPAGDMITYYSGGFSGTMWRQDDPNRGSDMEETIANAQSAAPASISADATVLDWPNEHNPSFSELRTGTNGWTCVPDDPATPTNDPWCMDAQWLEWLMAFFEGRDPEITAFGWAYMLQGGSGASDSDPSLMEPPEGEEWLIGPPHLMLIGPDEFDASAFPTQGDSGEPYIMWAGTPYEHFMIPVQLDIPAETDDPVANALSAAPDTIAARATVLDWPNDSNPGFTELRAGDNGWTCLPDDPATPSNDPMCLDDQWLEWLMAFAEGRDPVITELGFSYMLQGGSGVSDTDPMQMEPADGDEWLFGPPHVMMIAPESLDVDSFPTDRDSGGPYIMWASTPYEHFMAPSQLEAK